MLESTTYPGTTEEVVGPLLDAGSGLVAGRDYLLAYSPERIDPGNPTYGIRNAQMPGYVVTRLADLLNDTGLALSRSTVLCLGAAYKPDVADCRESPAIEVMRRLRRRARRSTTPTHTSGPSHSKASSAPPCR